MGRPGRVFFEGAVYHVYNRLARGEGVFDDDAEAEFFVRRLREVVERDGLTVFAYCLMRNHFHLAVRVGSVSLDRPMRSLQQRVTRGVNARRRVYGPLWQGRYRAKLVEEQRYLDQLLIYIHLNPVTAGLVQDPAEYRWSGHRELLGMVKDPIVDVDAVLRPFGRTRRSARSAYVRQLKVTGSEDWIGAAPGRLPWWRLGRPPKAEEDDPDEAYQRKRESQLKTPDDRPTLAVDEFVRRGALALGISIEDLGSRQRKAEVVRARETLTVIAVERYGLRVVDLAREMSKSPDSLTKAIRRATERRVQQREYADTLDRVDVSIATGGIDSNNGGMA